MYNFLYYSHKILLPSLLYIIFIVPVFAQVEDGAVINISNPKDGVSYNKLKRFNGSDDGIIINNSHDDIVSEKTGLIGGNEELENPAKIILIEVTGNERSKLEGEIKIIGRDNESEKVTLVLVNPNGITCNGCSFVNVDYVELRANKIGVQEGRTLFIKSPDSGINIEGRGINVGEGDLKLSSAKLKAKGGIYVGGKLIVEAYLDGISGESGGDGGGAGAGAGDNNSADNEKHFAIDIDTNNRIYAHDIELNAIGKESNIKITTPEFFTDEDIDEERYKLSGRAYVEIEATGDIFVKGTIYSGTSSAYLKIKGKNISVYSPGTKMMDVIGGLKNYDETKDVCTDSLCAEEELDEELFDIDPYIRSKGRLELEAEKIYLDRGVKIKGSGDFLRITGEVIGSGILESEGKTSIFSPKNISLSHISSYHDTSLVAIEDIKVSSIKTQRVGDVKLYGKKIDLNSVSDTDKLELYGEELMGRFELNQVNKVEMVGLDGSDKPIDFVVRDPVRFKGDFKFVGRDFRCQNEFEAKSVTLHLSGDFINDLGGNIIVEESWKSTSRGFTNYHNISVEEDLKVQGETLINDKKGAIKAGAINAYLTGQLSEDVYRGYGLYQGSNAILESRIGKMEITVPNGNLYFGYKKEFTGEGDNKDGYKFTGSQLISEKGGVYIQSGGDVIFDGTQILGDTVVEAKGVVQENNPTIKGAYRNGTKPVEKTRPKDVASICPETESYRECMRRGMFGECRHYETKTRTVNRPCTKTIQEKYTVMEARFEDITLETKFTGNKEVLDNKADLVFKSQEAKSRSKNSKEDFSRKMEEMKKWHDNLDNEEQEERIEEWFRG